MAETKKDALLAFDAFIETWGVKYDRATECLIKDRDALLAFYHFPADPIFEIVAGGSPLAIMGSTVIVFIEGMITVSRIGSNRNAIAHLTSLSSQMSTSSSNTYAIFGIAILDDPSITASACLASPAPCFRIFA